MSSGDRFICGIEIHQQLNTKKLFCSCDSELSEESTGTYFRRLRPTAGESGTVDRAALAESKKQIGFRYQSPARVSCLIDLDEFSELSVRQVKAAPVYPEAFRTAG